MEIMDYEKIVKQMIADEAISKEVAAKYFPELKEKESEYDRYKSAIRKMYSFLPNKPKYIGDVSVEDMFAWLEMQGEHANFRNKIQIGDRVTRNEDGVLVNLSQLNRVAKKDEKQVEQKITPIYRIGDTIIAKDGTYIEKEPFHIDRIEDDYYWDGENTILVCNQDEFEIFKQKPSFEMKTPEESLGIYSDTYNDIVNECIFGEQKSAWSEEDEAKLKSILFHIEDVENKDVINWLKSLKDRVQPQPKQEWSEEDEQYLKDTLTLLEGNRSIHTYGEVKKWLKSLRPQTTWKPSKKQMEALKQAKTDACGKPYFNALASLYVNLNGSIEEQDAEERFNAICERYRAMMKANEGKSFEERRDAINMFRAGIK